MRVEFTLGDGSVLEKDFPGATPSEPGELAWLMPHPPEWLLDPLMSGVNHMDFDTVSGRVADGREADARTALGL